MSTFNNTIYIYICIFIYIYIHINIPLYITDCASVTSIRLNGILLACCDTRGPQILAAPSSKRKDWFGGACSLRVSFSVFPAVQLNTIT